MHIEAHDLLQRFIERLKAAEDPEELERVFQETVAELGFKYFAYHVVSIGGVGDRLPYAITNYADEWARRYVHAGYLQIDPVTGEAPHRVVPYGWRELMAPERLTPLQRQMFFEAEDFGICDGLTIPMHGHGREFATMSLVPDGKAPSADIHLLHLLSLYYHQHSRSILLERAMSPPRAKALLSPREKETLQWVAVGKSAWEISEILGIAEKSVEFHVENAKRKLGVFNRTHAVVKAIMLGLIQGQ